MISGWIIFHIDNNNSNAHDIKEECFPICQCHCNAFACVRLYVADEKRRAQATFICPKQTTTMGIFFQYTFSIRDFFFSAIALRSTAQIGHSFHTRSHLQEYYFFLIFSARHTCVYRLSSSIHNITSITSIDIAQCERKPAFIVELTEKGFEAAANDDAITSSISDAPPPASSSSLYCYYYSSPSCTIMNSFKSFYKNRQDSPKIERNANRRQPQKPFSSPFGLCEKVLHHFTAIALCVRVPLRHE